MAKQTRISNANMMGLSEKLGRFSWRLFVPMCIVLAISIVVLYSAGGGNWRPYALSQLMKIILGFGVFFFAAFTNIKTWIKSAYVIYAIALIMIILVTFVGHTGMGAQRWLNLGFIHIQPSELIKIALVLALARYFAWFNSVELGQFKHYLVPSLMLLLPFALIVAQPDLGTALSLGMITVGVFYIVGANKKWFIIAAILGLMAAPVVWYGGLHDYQRGRIITFLNPDSDIQGAGYQINQAKIAFGSGGMTGKGYMKGSQSQQSFLPEKQTDFIFTMLGEEFGFLGAFSLLMIYTWIVVVLFWCAKMCRNRFGQLICFGFMLNFFVYYFINISMVLGLLPTVGVPLPLMSFGGSSLLSLMFGFGLCQNAYIHKDQQLSAKGS
ncbi:MAG: rod shape-determining protein RodA [Alphaproteobacteria bacterium]|nr:rod shape-determining protein RodA [Alphaproteobacteria bacterium]MBR6685172.1 rod shape-determining protein RodA [Alphaproteobacteria bacterium]